MIRRYRERRAAERRLHLQILVQYAALVLRLEGERRAWYAGAGPEPVLRRLPEEATR
jgi:hypothetical protein